MISGVDENELLFNDKSRLYAWYNFSRYCDVFFFILSGQDQSTYAKYRRKQNSRGITGAQLAREIIRFSWNDSCTSL